MNRVRLIMQKRPGFGPLAFLAHCLIVAVLSLRYLRWCPYSHAEIEIDGLCHSSMTDSGVRAARLTIDSTFRAYDAPAVDADDALSRFDRIEHMGYDWLGAVWWGFPWARHRPGRMNCFEAVAEMMGMPDPHKQGPFELIAWAQRRTDGAA
jgi:hypothetical protein